MSEQETKPNPALTEMRRLIDERRKRESTLHVFAEAEVIYAHMEQWYAANPQCDAGEVVRLREALALMYDKWENGDMCYEDLDTLDGFLGYAFKLSYEEENEILELLKHAPRAALSQPQEPKPMTEDQVLQQARTFCSEWVMENWWHEALPQLVAMLMQAASQLTDKQVYWLGVKAGIERHSYWCNGGRYVGIGATTLHEALAQADKEMQAALSKK